MMGLVEQEGLGAPPTPTDVAANVVAAGELEKLTLDGTLPAAAVADGVADDDGESDGGDSDDDDEEDEDEEREDGEEEGGGGAGSCEGEKAKKEEENDRKKKIKKKNKKGKQKGADKGGSTVGPVFVYPHRPNEPDCAYYMKRGLCKYGMNCRFNHPPEKTRHQQVAKGKEGLPERVDQPECKYYLRTGTCKFGGACRYHHPREKDGAGGKPELNFLGLPIRLGEKECPFYMRTGSCKYATNCKFHHPDPTAIGACPPASGYHQGGGSFPVRPVGMSQPPASSWPVQITSNDSGASVEASPSFMPVILPPHSILPIPGWNGYPAPVAPLLSHSAAAVNDQSARNADFLMNQQHEPLDDFPEKPGQPECQYFLKTGNCKFKAACKFHHPRSRVSKPLICALSPMGLPLRPDQTVCLHYSRYGICKFGSACKFDHPLTSAYQSPMAASIDGQCQPIEPSGSLEGERSIPHGNGELCSKASYVNDGVVGLSD